MSNIPGDVRMPDVADGSAVKISIHEAQQNKDPREF